MTNDEIFDILKTIKDPEHPLTLDQLHVIQVFSSSPSLLKIYRDYVEDIYPFMYIIPYLFLSIEGSNLCN